MIRVTVRANGQPRPGVETTPHPPAIAIPTAAHRGGSSMLALLLIPPNHQLWMILLLLAIILLALTILGRLR